MKPFSHFPRLAVALVLALMLLQACKKNYQDFEMPDQTARPVMVSAAEISNEPIPIEASGIVASKETVDLSFKIGGILGDIFTDEGQLVKKGQVLARLRLTEINARVNQAQNGLDKAQRDLQRVENLYRDTVATLEQFQDATTAFEVAKSELDIAKFNRRYAEIIAPANGRILRRSADEGEVLNPGRTVFSFGANGTAAYVIRVGVADKDIVRLANGDTALVHFDAYPGREFGATVTELAEAADPSTGTFEVELTLDPSQYAIKNGFIGKLAIFPSQQAPYYKISMNALVEGDKNTAKVYVLDEKTATAHRVRIRPDHIGDDFFTVPTAEVTLDQPLITEGAAWLREGSKVRPLNR